MKCDACGAPVENGVCTYCGKEFPQSDAKKDVNKEEEKKENKQRQPQKVVVNVVNQTPLVVEKNAEKSGFWRKAGLVLLWIYFFPIMLSYYFWKKSSLPKQQKIITLVAVWAVLLLIGGIASCVSDDEIEETTTVATSSISETAETKDLKSGDGSNVIGKVSVAHAKKEDVTDEALSEWYKTIVSDGDYNFCLIVYDDVNPTQGVYAIKSLVQKDVELIPDNDVYQLGSDRGSTVYMVKDDKSLEVYYMEPTEEEANEIISKIDSFVSSSFKGEGYAIDVGGDKNKLDAEITLVNGNLDNNTYQSATDYMARKIKESNLPIGYMNIAFQSDKFTIKALGSVDDVTTYTGPSDVSINVMN